jgi:hypothetical protein
MNVSPRADSAGANAFGTTVATPINLSLVIASSPRGKVLKALLFAAK